MSNDTTTETKTEVAEAPQTSLREAKLKELQDAARDVQAQLGYVYLQLEQLTARKEQLKAQLAQGEIEYRALQSAA